VIQISHVVGATPGQAGMMIELDRAEVNEIQRINRIDQDLMPTGQILSAIGNLTTSEAHPVAAPIIS